MLPHTFKGLQRLAICRVSASPIVITMQQPLGYSEAPSSLILPLQGPVSATMGVRGRYLVQYLLLDGQCFS
jgi:hypothetical protein